MAEVLLGVKAEGGGYQEVAGGGYARATSDGQIARFGPATEDWGRVRAWGVLDAAGRPAWVPLRAPVLVLAGMAVGLDDGTDTLTVAESRTGFPGLRSPGSAPDRAVALTARPHTTRITGR